MFDLGKSPIRENMKDLREGQLSIFEDDREEQGDMAWEQARDILRDVENMLKVQEANRDNRVRIAVMGEVKAGKSTFINVCAGREVAYTDILEATAVVSEITYSAREYVHILDREGNTVKDCTIEELLTWTEEQIMEEADFSQYGKIEIGLPNELFREMILVDTPGLLSITSKNHDVTNQYIAQADYVFWVLDSQNCGSKAVNDYIDKIRLSGKPMSGIVNKVDTREIQDEIEGAIEREYGKVFEEIFYVSSANAWAAIRNDHKGWAAETGFAEIFACMEDVSGDKEYSMEQTQYYQLGRERDVHRAMRERIRTRKDFYEGTLENFAQCNAKIKETLRAELGHWLDKELYREERIKLQNASGKEFRDLFAQFGSSVYLTEVREAKYNEMAGYIYQGWKIVEHSLALRSSQIMMDFEYDNSIAGEAEYGQEAAAAAAADSERQGFRAGAAAGVIFAGYLAYLGPAAETVTFAGALLPCVIPLAIGGAAVGSYLSKKRVDEKVLEDARKKQAAIEDLQRQVSAAMKKEQESMEKALFANTDYYYREFCENCRKTVTQVNFDFAEPYYSEFCGRLDQYIADLDSTISAIERHRNGNVQAPPSEDELAGGGAD